jgi:hypothetical protein
MHPVPDGAAVAAVGNTSSAPSGLKYAAWDSSPAAGSSIVSIRQPARASCSSNAASSSASGKSYRDAAVITNTSMRRFGSGMMHARTLSARASHQRRSGSRKCSS